MGDMLHVKAPDGVDPEAWADALDAIRVHCGWHVAPSAAMTLRVDGRGGRVLLLPSLHVTRVVEVRVDGVVTSAYRWSEGGMLERTGGVWPVGFGRIEVDLEHGFDDLPRPVSRIARSLTSAAATNGLGQVATGPFTISAPVGYEGGGVGLTSVQAAVLAPYVIEATP